MRLLDFIVADDVRREVGNKVSVMGVFNESINLSIQEDTSWPVLFRLGLYIRILIDEADEIPDHFLLKIFHNNETIAEFGGTIALTTQGERPMLITLPLVANPLPIPSSGVLTFQLQLTSKEVNIFSSTSPFPVTIS